VIADRAQPPRRVVVAVKVALLVAIARPGRRQLKVDPIADRGGDQRASPPRAVRLKPRVKVLRVADVVTRVTKGALEVQQVFGRRLGYAEVLRKSSQTAVRRGDWSA